MILALILHCYSLLGYTIYLNLSALYLEQELAKYGNV